MRNRRLLEHAIENISEGLAVYDHEDRLALSNRKYREIYKDSADLLVPGTRFEDIIREGVARGQYAEAVGREEEWIQQRLSRHRNPGGGIEQELGTGSWIYITERKTTDGFTVGIRADVTEKKSVLEELERTKQALEQRVIERTAELALSEQRTAEAHARLKDAIEAMSEGFVMFDTEDRLVLCNSKFLECFRQIAHKVGPGITFRELLGLSVKHGLEDIGEQALEDWIEHRLAARRNPKGPFELYLAEGRWLRVNERRTRDGCTITTYVDITSVKQKETALRTSEQKFRDFAEASADWFWETGPDHRFTYMSSNVEELTGFSAQYYIGKSRRQLMADNIQDAESWAAHLNALRRRKPFRSFTYRYDREGLPPIWIRTSGVPVFGENGEFLGYRGSGSDVTEEKEREEALRKSEEQIRLIADNLPVLITFLDKDKRYNFVNHTGVEWYGRELDEIVGHSVDEIHTSPPPKLADAMRRVLCGEHITFEERIRYPDGKTRDVRATYIPHFDREAEIQGFFGLVQDITEQRSTQQALRESQLRYANIVETSSEGIIAIDMDQRVVVFNHGAEQIFGWTAEEAIGENIAKLLPERIRSRHKQDIENFAESGNTSRIMGRSEVVGLRKDGSEFPAEAMISRIDLGDETLLTVMLNDISERKEAEDALRASEEQMRLIADNLPVLIAYVDADSRYRFVNKTLADWYARNASEIVGHHAKDILGQGYLQLKPKWDAVLAGERMTFETQLTYPDGKTRDIVATCIPHVDQAGVVRGFFGLVQDITQQKHIQEALKANEQQLRLITDSVPVMIAYLDTDHRYRFVNRVAETWFARSKDEILGQHVEDVMAEAIIGADLTALLDEASKGKAVTYDATVDFPDGVTREVAASFVPHIGESGELRGFFELAQDVSTLKETEKRLAQAQKSEAVGQLTGGIAHDFNNILGIILGNLDVLQDHVTESSPGRKLLTAAINASTRAADQVQRLLAFARQQPLKPRPTDTTRLMSDLSQLLGRTLAASIDFKIVLPNEPLCAMVDPGQLENAIINLSVNARDAMPDGGSLTLEAARVHIDQLASAQEDISPGDYVRIAVSDTGCGMPESVAARAFDPFFTTKEIGKGSGLGLSMVYGFVKQSGGHVKIYSEEGAGTTIKLYLPATAADSPDTADTNAAQRQDSAHGGETVLVVEDDPDLRQIAVVQLESLGYAILQAEDGPSALQVIERSDDIDLLFTDVMLPGGMNGRQLAEAALSQRPDLKVVYTTGYTEDAITRHDLVESEARLLQKPYTKSQLSTTLRGVLDGRSTDC
ncbi:MAG: PAS domain S-box protein [Alphaproteobacteria bacterium]|nr:PAS domain S-box protein [Alphaproteobacteria bacterium]